MGFGEEMLQRLRGLQEMQEAILGHERSQLPDVESHRQPEPDRFVVAPNVARDGVRGPRDRRRPSDAADDRRRGLHGLRLRPRRWPLHRHIRHRPRRRARLRLRLSGAPALQGPDEWACSSNDSDFD